MNKQADADKLGQLADRHFQAGAFDKAKDAYREALSIAVEIANLKDQALYLGNLGVACVCSDDLRSAVGYLQQALQLARQLQDVDLEMFVLDKLGVALHQAGFHGSATQCLIEGIQKARTNGNHAIEESMCGHLGNVFSANGAFHKAEPYYKRALELAQTLGDQKGVGIWLSNLGNNYLGLERYDIAKEHYERALSTARSVGDQETEARCTGYLTIVAEKLRARTKERQRDPATTPGAFVFFGLAARVSQLTSIEEKRDLIASQKTFINDAINTALRLAPPEEALALIDCVKSLIGRELMTRCRGEIAGRKADIVVHGFNPSQVCEIVAREQDLATVSFYYTEEKTFYAFVSFFRDGRPKVEKVVLASGTAGRNFHTALLMLAEKRRNSPFEEIDEILVNLLNDIGQAIVPRLRRIKHVRRVLLIPFKLLYLLPLHAMLSAHDKDMAMLEEIGPNTYSSSLCAYYSRGKWGRQQSSGKYVLSFIDVAGLSGDAIPEMAFYGELRDLYFEATGDRDAILVVTDPANLPSDIGVYQTIAWSSHAYSNPTNWTASHLRAGKRIITAKEIMETWRLGNTIVVILSACETGIDKSIDDDIDEYFGIDMAVHIAGAQTVVSTMWPVEERLAGLVSFFLGEGIAKHQAQPAGYLRQVRYDLLSGCWRDKVEAAYANLTSDQKIQHGKKFDWMLAMGREDFQRIGCWANYRTFGGW